jgi:epoxide hydrolase-like predicted phosphatase
MMGAMATKVEAVLWDVGGVFLPSPFTKIRSHATEQGMDGDRLLELVFGPYHQDTDHPWHQLERGQMTFEACNAALAALAVEEGMDVDPMAVLLNMGGDGLRIVRDDVVAAAVAAKASGRKAAIVTNNIKEFSEGWRGLFEDLDAMVDVIVDSSAIGLRKPDPAIFHHALAELGGIAPAAAVFLDDAPGNIAAARDLGIHAILVEDEYQPALDELAEALAA